MSDSHLKHELYDKLAEPVKGIVEFVSIGLNWTVVAAAHGVGAAHTPIRGSEGCTTTPRPGQYASCGLGKLAELKNSSNVFERAIGLAAINAFYNRTDLIGDPANGLDLLQDFGHETVIIGRFPGLAARVPGAAVIERNPGPGDFPESAARELLPKCKHLAITASALVNGSLPELLAMAPQAYTVLIGPSTPFAPVLFEYGIDAMSGFVVDDLSLFQNIVLEGGSVRQMRPAGRNLTLLRGEKGC